MRAPGGGVAGVAIRPMGNRAQRAPSSPRLEGVCRRQRQSGRWGAQRAPLSRVSSRLPAERGGGEGGGKGGWSLD